MAEVQANSPEMIYLGFGEVKAKQILGAELYDYLDERIPVEGGQSHKFYGEIRTLPANSPERLAAGVPAKAYHASLANADLDQDVIEQLLRKRSMEWQQTMNG